jgi:SAM-dependent methyltransferase
MTREPHSPETQAEFWNAGSGQAWVESQELLDQALEPFEKLLVEGVDYRPGDRVLDVGCGTGTTTLGVALRTRAEHCTGVDISRPMIEAARARAARAGATVDFIVADAQSHSFDEPRFDVLISRFGVMFFEDPVAAFANLRRAVREAASLRFVAWRSAAENPFMTTAERAAAPLLPEMPPRQPNAPGQFAFADKDRVSRILAEGGWDHIDIRPVDKTCRFPARHLVTYFTRLGPLGRMLDGADEQTRRRVVDAVRPAFDAFVHGDEVRFVGSCWEVRARAAAR